MSLSAERPPSPYELPTSSLNEEGQNVAMFDSASQDECMSKSVNQTGEAPSSMDVDDGRLDMERLEQLRHAIRSDRNDDTLSLQGSDASSQITDNMQPFDAETELATENHPPLHFGTTQPCAGFGDDSQVCDDDCSTECAVGDDTHSTSADLDLLRERRKLWENRWTLSALIAIVGSVRFTVDQYEYTRSILREVSPGNTEVWPSYAKIQRCFKDIVKYSMPRSSVIKLLKKVKDMESIARGCNEEDRETVESRQNERQHQEMEPVRIFFQSSWAEMNVATSTLFSEIVANPNADETNLEASTIARDRAGITNTSKLLFAYIDGECVPCFTNAIVTISAQRSDLFCQSSFQIRQDDHEIHFDRTVAATWIKGSSSSRVPSADDALCSEQYGEYLKRIITCLSKANHRPISEQPPLESVLPGHICTVLTSGREVEEGDYLPIIVHKFWRYEQGMPSVILLWVKVNDAFLTPTQTLRSPNMRVQVAGAHLVTSIGLRRQGLQPNTQLRSNCSGILPDGTPFITYRMMLYCDNFQKSSFSSTSASAGGCYFMPLAYPPEKRRSTSSARLISLTPPGVSTNEVLEFITDDIIHGSTQGIDCRTLGGKKVKVFLDAVGFIGDYPASGVVDVMGHVSRAPCTLCSFKRLNQIESTGSRYGYTTAVHANNTAFLRNAERYHALCESNIDDTDGTTLGMISKQRVRVNKTPLMTLYHKLQQKKNMIPLGIDGYPVVQRTFDPYRCNFVAPDHLLTGLTKDVLNTVLLCLPNKESRLEADIRICAALRENGLLRQRGMFNLRTNSLHSMTLSELFCAFTRARVI